MDDTPRGVDGALASQHGKKKTRGPCVGVRMCALRVYMYVQGRESRSAVIR